MNCFGPGSPLPALSKSSGRRGSSPVPKKRSTSGSSLIKAFPKHCGRQPVTTSRRHFPCSLAAAMARIVSTDSSCASRMKPQVLMMTTSASSRAEGTQPFSCRRPSITSLSTIFFGHPRLIMRTVPGDLLTAGLFSSPSGWGGAGHGEYLHSLGGSESEEDVGKVIVELNLEKMNLGGIAHGILDPGLENFKTLPLDH